MAYSIDAAAIGKLKSKWLLSPSFRNDYCNSYFVLFWQPEYFRSKLSEYGNGYIRKDALMYQVRYHNCTPEQVLQTKSQLALSFREPARDLGVDPVVLVSICKLGQGS